MLKGIGHTDGLDSALRLWIPSTGKAFVLAKALRLLIWNLQRLSLTQQSVWIDYVENYNYRLAIGKADILMGQAVCKEVGISFKKNKNNRIPCTNIFVTTSPSGALAKPTETYRINRMIYLGAVAAKLEPKVDLDVPLFDEFISRDRF